jgi:hypothetical protein
MQWPVLRRFALGQFEVITSLETIVFTHREKDWSHIGQVETADAELLVIHDENVVMVKRKIIEDDKSK